MESIEKARAAIAKDWYTNANLADAFGLGDAPLFTTLLAVLDAIEAEIAEKYMRLPLDADGVPIHIGDRMLTADSKAQVVRAVGVGGFNDTPLWCGADCHHESRTLEDVLQSAGVSVAAIEDVASEIRELLGMVEE